MVELDPQRHERINQLFAEAIRRTPDERAAFLDDACEGDLALRAEVKTLLSHHEQAAADGFLERGDGRTIAYTPVGDTNSPQDPTDTKASRVDNTPINESVSLPYQFKPVNEGPTRSFALEELNQIDVICAHFEAQWADSRLRIEDLLGEVSAASRDELLRYLLLLEVELLAKDKEPADPSTYLSRFPDHRETVLAVLRWAHEHGWIAGLPSPSLDDTAELPSSNTSVNVTVAHEPPSSGDDTATQTGQFGPYELLEEIARGGMGVVYRARQAKANRIVALKMILSGQLAGEQEVKRFYTEAEAAAALDHPNIVPIFDVGQQNGQHYFSMGFVEGQSLADRIREEPLPPREAGQIVKTIAEAVHYAHQKGIIHRDLKPGNVLLDATGNPRVTDFGLAKQVGSGADLTATGQVMGTPSYMPPEQALGKISALGPTADVYSLGAILYAALTGRPPFRAASMMETLQQVVKQEPVEPRLLNPAVDKDLETICLKCVEKDPEGRYASAEEVSLELQRYLNGEPIHARAISQVARAWRWCKRNPMVSTLSASVFLVVLVGASVSTLLYIKADQERRDAVEARELAKLEDGRANENANKFRREKDRAESEKERANENEKQAISNEQQAIASQQRTEAALAESHYFLAQARWKEDRIYEANQFLEKVPTRFRRFEWYLARRQFLGSDITCYGHTTPISGVAFSPDGTRLASGSRDKTIKLWDAARGRELQTLAGHTHGVPSVAFSPDGKLIYSLDYSGKKIVWDSETGKQLKNEDWKKIDTDQQHSPDKRWLVTSSANHVLLVDLEFKNTPREKAYREFKAKLKPWWHLNQAKNAEKDKNWFAATFHRAWVLKADPDAENGVDLLKAAYEKLKAAYAKPKKELDPYLQPAIREMLDISKIEDSEAHVTDRLMKQRQETRQPRTTPDLPQHWRETAVISG